VHVSAQAASIIFAGAVLLVVFEMVRRRYLRERYAILWLGAALTLLVLAAWRGLLERISHAVGIATPSNAFFVIAFAFLLLLVLHFSSVVSRLSDETRVLAQRLALVEQERDPPRRLEPQAARRSLDPQDAAAGEDDREETEPPLPPPPRAGVNR
jgi:hypothetical protein